MKMTVFLFLLLISKVTNAQTYISDSTVDIQADFPGGTKALYGYLGKKLKCPEQAKRANVTGKILVSFTIHKDGSVKDVKMLRGIGFGVDEEVIRVIKAMPKWVPARKKGRKVISKFILPITDLCWE